MFAIVRNNVIAGVLPQRSAKVFAKGHKEHNIKMEVHCELCENLRGSLR